MESAGTLEGAVKVVVEVLLARFGSAVAAKTVLVLLTVPAMLGLRTTSTTVADAVHDRRAGSGGVIPAILPAERWFWKARVTCGVTWRRASGTSGTLRALCRV